MCETPPPAPLYHSGVGFFWEGENQGGGFRLECLMLTSQSVTLTECINVAFIKQAGPQSVRKLSIIEVRVTVYSIYRREFMCYSVHKVPGGNSGPE